MRDIVDYYIYRREVKSLIEGPLGISAELELDFEDEIITIDAEEARLTIVYTGDMVLGCDYNRKVVAILLHEESEVVDIRSVQSDGYEYTCEEITPVIQQFIDHFEGLISAVEFRKYLDLRSN